VQIFCDGENLIDSARFGFGDAFRIERARVAFAV
jgi:hypothetical protein